MATKKVLIRWLLKSTPEREWFMKPGQVGYITVREAEAWAFSGEVMGEKKFEIIDPKVIVIRKYVPALENYDIEIKFKPENERKNE